MVVGTRSDQQDFAMDDNGDSNHSDEVLTANGNAANEAHMEMVVEGNLEILHQIDDQISLNQAAHQCRLPGEQLTSQEASCFPDVISAHVATQRVYLYLRNKILQFWLQNCTEELTLNTCLTSIPEPFNSDVLLVRRVHAFLERYGFINFGLFKIDTPVAVSENSRKRVIVIGAGIAGITAARQLHHAGIEVILLEGRNRVGGRICTFRKGNYIADLGAMVITGLGGNPLQVIITQLPIHVQKIRSKCPLYESDGSAVAKEADCPVEKQYNKVLEGAAYLAHTMGYEDKRGRKASLGETMRLVIKMQEKKVKEQQLEYWKTTVEIQDKLKRNLHKMIRMKDSIQRMQAQLDESTSRSRPSSDGDCSADDIVNEFVVRSRQRDLNVACQDFQDLKVYQHEIEDTLAELAKCEPPRQYMSAREKNIFNWHLANLEFANATCVDNLSLKYWSQDDDFEFSGSHLSVPKGFSSIPQLLSEGLDIRFNSAVTNIDYSSSEAKVTYREVISNPEAKKNMDSSESSEKAEKDRGAKSANVDELIYGDEHTLTAEAVLCTLPLGVLKASLHELGETATVKFVPSLPAWKTDSINRLGFGNLNKVALCFDNVFWDSSLNIFGQVQSVEKSRGEFFQFYNINQFRAGESVRVKPLTEVETNGEPKDSASNDSVDAPLSEGVTASSGPVLIGLLAGESADAIESLSDDLIVGTATRNLQTMHRIPSIRAVDHCVTRWRKDPWTRGSYSYVYVEATGDDYDQLAQPVTAGSETTPRLFFAGEHTMRNYPATVHGAMLSGLREAGRIADNLLGTPYAP